MNFRKDDLGEALRPGGVYSGSPPAPDRPLHIAPATTEASPEEKLAQELYAQEIEREADAIGEADLSRAHRARAALACRSMPYMEYRDRLKRMQEAAGNLPGSGMDFIENRAGLEDAKAKFKESQVYNPMLVSILTGILDHGSGLKPEQFLSPNPSEADLAAVDAANVILGPTEKSVKSRGPLTKERIEMLVRMEFARQSAGMDARLGDIRKGIEDLKRQAGIR